MSAKFTLASLAFLALAPAALAPEAYADDKPQQLFVTVGYSDLNLSVPAGARTLLDRIEMGARKVCGASIPRSPLLQLAATKCQREAVHNAVNRLGYPMLIQAWSGNYPAMAVAAR